MAFAMAVIAAPVAHSQTVDYPNRPVRLIVPYPAGGSADLVARLFADRLSARLKQPVVVENKPGAGVIVGTQMVAKAAPDGYKLLLITLAHSINATLNKSLPYDSMNDFEFISTIGSLDFVVVTHPSTPVSSVSNLLEFMKKEPNASFGSAGIGSPMHLGGALLAKMAGVAPLHVPYLARHGLSLTCWVTGAPSCFARFPSAYRT
ncbi:hypothetical protein AWV79_33960 [Cupriavidus sp. UYMMa02A]|nr:hypothetical protein AWV79_33960 [Cupriavidus sp. UYMMa02A]